MNLHRWLATLFVLLGLAGCAQQGQAPHSSYSPNYNAEYPRDKSGDGGGGGGM